MSTRNTRQNSRLLCLALPLTFSLVLLFGLLLVMSAARPLVALATSSTIRYVDGATGNDSGNDCSDNNNPCATIQVAVDAANDSDVIKVAAGVYTDVQTLPVPVDYPSPPAGGEIAQVVYISKSVTIQGGYTTTNGFTGPPDPEANPTTLDALEQGRVLFITAPAPGAGISSTVEGLRLTGGNAYEWGGGMNNRHAGGGVYVINATTTISNCWLFDNIAYNGGGLYLYNSAATLDDNTIASNIANNGGGLYFYDSDVTLNSNTIASNTANFWSGGLHLRKSSATFRNNTFTANTARYDGGGLGLDESTATFNGNTVLSNTAGGNGGGLHLYKSDATLNGNTITSNTASYNGGGLHLSRSDAILNNTIITANTAGHDGGGLHLYSSDATFSSNTVSSNTADYHGGGLSVYDNSNITFNSDTVISNTAIYSGGGLYLQYSNATLNDNIISSNTASEGGGLYLWHSGLTLINNIVADNQASSIGSGIYVKGSSPYLKHTTIARNTGGDGSGLCVVTGKWGVRSSVDLVNTILVSHTVGITVASGNNARLEATLWGTDTWANLADWGGEGNIFTGTINLWDHPVFVNPGAGDYHIGSASAARDAGVDAGIERDIDGQMRSMDWGYDLGADEFPGVGLDVVKKVSEVSANPGQTLTFTIIVTSVGAENATGVVLTDTLDGWQRPLDVTFSAGECSVTDGGWSGDVVCSLDTLVPGATTWVTLTTQVSTSITPRQAMVNTVVVTANETMNSVQVTTFGGDCHARINDDPKEYTSVQAAVDAASPGDLIKVAGVCVGASERGGLRQQIYPTKSLTIQGGYTTTTTTNGFAGPPDPVANPTTLDALGQGRVLYVAGSINLTLKGLRITDGDATGLGGGTGGRDAGGGVYVTAATIVLSDTHVFGNIALVGGGLYFQNNDETWLMNNLISNNDTFRYGAGGGMYFESSANVMLTGNTISNNQAGPWSNGRGTGGGAVFYNSPGAILTDNIVSGNRASWSGGLYFNQSPTATLIANTISDNVANHAGGGMKDFGGVHFYLSDDATLLNNTISGNHTANTCGGVCFTASHNAVLSANIIISNTRGAWWDGYGVGVYLNGCKNTKLVANVISHNTASNLDSIGSILGGGLYIGNSTATLVSNTINSNGATRGGGLYINANSIVTLTSDIITGNIAYDSCGAWCYTPGGGGLYLNNSVVTLTNVIIADNQAETTGGGLHVQNSSSQVLHATIARNSGGDGSGAHVAGIASSVIMTNTILVSHTTGITVAAGNTATLQATLWGTDTWANGTDWDGEGHIITGTINLRGDPDFVNPAVGGYHIGPDSAARDTGIDAGVTTDIDGDPRPMGHGYDIGADELRIALIVTKYATPNSVRSGEQLTYTLRVTNTGDVDLHAAITDTLPSHIMPGEMPGGILTWTGIVLTPDGVWTETVVVTVALGYAGPVTNVIKVTSEEGATGVYTEVISILPNQPPYTPSQPVPINGTTNVPLTQTLHWQGGDPDGDPVTYTIALRAGDAPPTVTQVLTTSYDPGILANDTAYMWTVTATDGMSISVGQTWNFTTVQPNRPPYTPSLIAPGNGAVNVPLTQTLSWQGGDPDGDKVTYTVALSTSNPPLPVTQTLTTSYAPGGLISGTTYYWIITATDGMSISVGPTWCFTTVPASNLDVYRIYLPLVMTDFDPRDIRIFLCHGLPN